MAAAAAHNCSSCSCTQQHGGPPWQPCCSSKVISKSLATIGTLMQNSAQPQSGPPFSCTHSYHCRCCHTVGTCLPSRPLTPTHGGPPSASDPNLPRCCSWVGSALVLDSTVIGCQERSYMRQRCQDSRGLHAKESAGRNQGATCGSTARTYKPASEYGHSRCAVESGSKQNRKQTQECMRS